MNPILEDAEKELLEKFEKVKEDLGRVYVSFEDLRNATAYDDISKALEELEDIVKDVRTGGIIGSGANSHKRARKKWLEAGGANPDQTG